MPSLYYFFNIQLPQNFRFFLDLSRTAFKHHISEHVPTVTIKLINVTVALKEFWVEKSQTPEVKCSTELQVCVYSMN